jgi:hypothetical protein
MLGLQDQACLSPTTRHSSSDSDVTLAEHTKITMRKTQAKGYGLDRLSKLDICRNTELAQ